MVSCAGKSSVILPFRTEKDCLVVLCASAPLGEKESWLKSLFTRASCSRTASFLSAGISARPGSTSAASPRTLSRLYLSLRCGPGRVCAACFSRSGPPARLSPSGLPPPQVLARDSPPTSQGRLPGSLPPFQPASLPSRWPPPSASPPFVLALFTPHTHASSCRRPPSRTALHGKTHWFPQKTQL